MWAEESLKIPGSKKVSNCCMATALNDYGLSDLHGCSPHASRIRRRRQDSTLTTVCAGVGVTLTGISVLWTLICPARLIALSISLHADVTTLAPISPGIANQPVVLARISAVTNELNSVIPH